MVDSVSRIRSLGYGYGTVCGCRGDYGIMNTEMSSIRKTVHRSYNATFQLSNLVG